MSFWTKLFAGKEQPPAKPSPPAARATSVSSPPPRSAPATSPTGNCRVCRRQFDLQDMNRVPGNAGTYICRSCDSKVSLTELKF